MRKRRSGSLLSLRDQLETVGQYSGRALDYKLISQAAENKGVVSSFLTWDEE